MDFSNANVALWQPIVQIGIIAGLLLGANIIRRKIGVIKKSLIPTAVLAGFILLIVRTAGVIKMNTNFLETLTYHALALGFIALSLRVPEKVQESGKGLAVKNGALIVSTYLVQAIIGLGISIGLAYTFMPDFFKASGILLAMGYGQGPGQANNVGVTYEGFGFIGGQSFGLAIAAAGYLCACLVGVVYLNICNRKCKLNRNTPNTIISGSVTVEEFQNENEIPIAESVDKLSVQAALIVLVYLITYLVTWGLCSLLDFISSGLAGAVSSLLRGFNFIIGSLVATIFRSVMSGLRKTNIMKRQYQNNYLLSRISGLAFDVMIICGIASIEINDLKGLWVPFILMSVLGGVVTFAYLKFMCKKIYPKYEYEAFFSMFGMLTGTISSGVLLLREIDPHFKTPASNNLITGSSMGIIFGAPILLMVSLAAKSTLMVFVTFGLVVLYLAILLFIMFKVGNKKNK